MNWTFQINIPNVLKQYSTNIPNVLKKYSINIPNVLNKYSINIPYNEIHFSNIRKECSFRILGISLEYYFQCYNGIFQELIILFFIFIYFDYLVYCINIVMK